MACDVIHVENTYYLKTGANSSPSPGDPFTTKTELSMVECLPFQPMVRLPGPRGRPARSTFSRPLATNSNLTLMPGAANYDAWNLEPVCSVVF